MQPYVLHTIWNTSTFLIDLKNVVEFQKLYSILFWHTHVNSVHPLLTTDTLYTLYRFIQTCELIWLYLNFENIWFDKTGDLIWYDLIWNLQTYTLHAIWHTTTFSIQSKQCCSFSEILLNIILIQISKYKSRPIYVRRQSPSIDPNWDIVHIFSALFFNHVSWFEFTWILQTYTIHTIWHTTTFSIWSTNVVVFQKLYSTLFSHRSINTRATPCTYEDSSHSFLNRSIG